MLQNNKGYTLVELMTIIAIIGIMAGVVIPNAISWRTNSTFSGVVRNLKGDLEYAKSRAIRDNEKVTVQYFSSSNNYTVVTSDGETIRNRKLANIDVSFPSSIEFNGKGQVLLGNGTITLKSSNNHESSIKVTRIGRVSIL